jgi:predicted RNA methylase
MRAEARIAAEQGRTVTRETESTRWRAELLDDGRVNVVIDLGVRVGAIAHVGSIASVRARLAFDADARDRAAISTAVRDIATDGSPVGGR